MIQIGTNLYSFNARTHQHRSQDGSDTQAGWLQQMELAQLQAMSAATSAPTLAFTARAPHEMAEPDRDSAALPAAHTNPSRVAGLSMSPHASLPSIIGFSAVSSGGSAAGISSPKVPAMASPHAGTADIEQAATQLRDTADPSLSAMTSSTKLGGVPVMMTATPHPGTSSAEPPPQSETSMANNGEPWQERHLHMQSDGEDIRLWIRDATLQAHETATLLHRLAGDLASKGLRLTDASVNGKSAYVSATSAQERRDPVFISLLKDTKHGSR